jgi:hypothetical protein
MPPGAARLVGPPRVTGLGDQVADVAGGELPQHVGMHGVLLAGSSRVEPADGDQDQAQVADPVQQPVQGGLVCYRAVDDRLAFVAVDLEVLEPGRPALVEDSLDADLIVR